MSAILLLRYSYFYRKNLTESATTFTVPLYFPDEFKSLSNDEEAVHSSGYAHISRSSVFLHYSLKLVRFIHSNDVAVRHFSRLSDRGPVLCLEA